MSWHFKLEHRTGVIMTGTNNPRLCFSVHCSQIAFVFVSFHIMVEFTCRCKAELASNSSPIHLILLLFLTGGFPLRMVQTDNDRRGCVLLKPLLCWKNEQQILDFGWLTQHRLSLNPKLEKNFSHGTLVWWEQMERGLTPLMLDIQWNLHADLENNDLKVPIQRDQNIIKPNIPLATLGSGTTVPTSIVPTAIGRAPSGMEA